METGKEGGTAISATMEYQNVPFSLLIKWVNQSNQLLYQKKKKKE